ncbi:methyltransferase domain-containing protein [Rhizobium sp. P38BS-XIX]|uniref:methyltransferase domain-containing protein n=1 Tax=Rhizobium sp. P38BS-XIX TaxID=2726740 RepID=UPI0014575F92|nr:methyltransferase domain-containing protein [Rhizobium sp. P38BS-XIX]NLR99422.1 methyltransferase domain-containing protein [Rhizobium sp. P38BS-XIX]
MQAVKSNAKLIEMILESCGYGKLLQIGSNVESLLPGLIAQGVDAHTIHKSGTDADLINADAHDREPDSSFLELPFADEYFETIVSIGGLEKLATNKVAVALGELYRVSSRYVFLRLATGQSPEAHLLQTRQDRTWWETRCFEAGFRKHPLFYQVNPYESLNSDGSEILIALEKAPKAALQHFDLLVLAEERLLHTDMLRETGRRSDAHCIRYHKAVEYIRPGDRVLDVACGLGYGSHILYSSSSARSVIGIDLSDFSIDYANAHYGRSDAVRFEVGDAQALSQIPDNSIDFITAFETIEHVPDPDEYLTQLKRVLKPSGRLMVCAPNNWVDETGKDPNPYHLHVYTWARLIEECGSHFLLEKGFFQTAGGGMRYHHSPRGWVEAIPKRECEQDGEWVLLLCMADPINGKDVAYEETSWSQPDSPDFNVSAFARDYKNPWLVKGMIAIGMRAQSEDLLQDMQKSVLEMADPTSTDFASALCGQVYALAKQGRLTDTTLEEIRASALRYAGIIKPSPHQLRWQVSLLFAVGEVARKSGNLDDAERFYSMCAAIDVTPYSALLGNKTLDALYWLSILAVAKHNIEQARAYLEKSVLEAQRLMSAPWLNMIGNSSRPLPFGFPELSQLMDRAARAAYMLNALDECQAKPGLFHHESQGFFERQLSFASVRSRDLEANVDLLARNLTEAETSKQELARQVSETEERAQDLGRQVIETEARAQDFARQVVALNAQLLKLANAQGSLCFQIMRGFRFISRRISRLISKNNS